MYGYEARRLWKLELLHFEETDSRRWEKKRTTIKAFARGVFLNDNYAKTLCDKTG